MKNLIFLLLILNSISFGLFAQNTEIDSLENLLQQHTQKDTVRINLLNEIAYKIYYINIDKTLKIRLMLLLTHRKVFLWRNKMQT